MIVCDYLLVKSVFKAKDESNSAAGTRVASNPAAQASACGYGSVRRVAEGLKQSEALLLIGGSQSLGAENTAGEAFGAPECAGLDG